jgi:hypothetical protein
MGIVIINGQKYDSVTGLQIEGSDLAAPDNQENSERPAQAAAAPKPRRRSKQERLAEAIAQEFKEPEIATPALKEVPDWINQFTVRQDSIKAQPDWITNYIAGGQPVEIQPIGLEAAAIEAKKAAAARAEKVRRAAEPNQRQTQRSRTLNRNFVRKPGERIKVVKHQAASSSLSPSEIRRPRLSDRQPEPFLLNETRSEIKEEAPFAPIMTHAMEEKLAQRELVQSRLVSSDLKDALINEQLNQPVDRKQKAKAEREAARTRRRFTAPTLITAALAILVLGGYFTYVSMPSISVRMAAARAGVDAHAPYTPSGYSIDGPVAYEPGRVTINYKSNGGGEGYSLTQQNNTWGENVVMNQLVEGSNYSTISNGDVTIYRYGDQVAWIERDILFTLSGNTSLGDDQLTRIIDSL